MSSSYRRRAAISSRQASCASRRRSACSAPQNASSTSSWNDGTREPALLELPRHGDEALGCGRNVLARDGASPGIGARAPVAEDAPRDHEPRLTFGSQLGERSELLVVEEAVGNVELGLDVCLRPLGADRRGIGARPEEQPDRLREDRLPRARLARDRVQPGREGELRLADEDEILDPEPTKQAATA